MGMDYGRQFGEHEEVKLTELGQCWQWGKLANINGINGDSNVWSSFAITHFNQSPKANFLEERHSIWGHN